MQMLPKAIRVLPVAAAACLLSAGGGDIQQKVYVEPQKVYPPSGGGSLDIFSTDVQEVVLWGAVGAILLAAIVFLAVRRRARRRAPAPAAPPKAPAADRPARPAADMPATGPAPKIFLSYRREDTATISGFIYRELNHEFGEAVMMDVDSIPFGVDFRAHIKRALKDCDLCLAIIGRDWVTAADGEGRRRLEDPADYVRIEIETALARGVPVVPVLVEGASMPRADQLPDSLGELVYRNGIQVRPAPDFSHDMSRLIAGIRASGRQAAAE